MTSSPSSAGRPLRLLVTLLALALWLPACHGWRAAALRQPGRTRVQASAQDYAYDGMEESEDDDSLWWKPSVPTTRFAARLAYDGTRFNGWQYQVKSRTVQLELERALNSTLPPHLLEGDGALCLRAVAAGRTDAGVHARGQTVHFDLPTAEVVDPIQGDPQALESLLNARLPPDLRLWNVSRAPPPVAKNLAVGGEWHAMYNAEGKLYSYRFATRPVADPMQRLVRAHVGPRMGGGHMDVEALARLAAVFEGEHDFQNFANRLQHKRRASRKGEEFTTVRRVRAIELVDERQEFGEGCYRLDVRLDGALQRMVRNMVGALWAVARGDLEEAELRRALTGPLYPTGRSPIRAAPAHGLTLEWVYYDDY